MQSTYEKGYRNFFGETLKYGGLLRHEHQRFCALQLVTSFAARRSRNTLAGSSWGLGLEEFETQTLELKV